MQTCTDGKVARPNGFIVKQLFAASQCSVLLESEDREAHTGPPDCSSSPLITILHAPIRSVAVNKQVLRCMHRQLGQSDRLDRLGTMHRSIVSIYCLAGVCIPFSRASLVTGKLI